MKNIMRRLNQHCFVPRLLVGTIAVLAILLSGCQPETTAGRPPVSEPTPASGLLPTPTLAMPGSIDPLKPPTPMVHPSPTPQGGAAADAPTQTAVVSAEATSTVEEPQPPTAVPLPADATPRELLEIGQRSAAEGDHAMAAAAFKAAIDDPNGLLADEVEGAHLGLAVAFMAEGRYDAALTELETLTRSPRSRSAMAKGGELIEPVSIADAAVFHLGQVRAISGDYTGAIDAYSTYLTNNPDMAAYIQPLIANAYEALDDSDAVIAALEGAVAAPAQRFKALANRMRLASLYLAREDYQSAIEQYDAIQEFARTEATKGQMAYLAGRAELLAGNTEAAHERFRFGVMNFPRAAESYQGLIALLDAGASVDEYQRGIVDFYAGAYIPAIEAFGRYIAAEETYNADAHLFAAWSHEGLGDTESALAELDKFAEHEPARSLFERGEILRRAARPADALAAYDEFLAEFPEADSAASVAWSAASLSDDQGHTGTAERYLFLADSFPFNENAPRALYRASELIAVDEPEEALALRQRLVDQYPANIYGAEALFRMLQAAEAGDIEGLDESLLADQLSALSPSNYFALRAADYAGGVAPFSAEGPMVLPDDPSNGRIEAETWLSERLTASGVALPEGELSMLSGDLAADPQRIIGAKLWQLGLLEEAKAELEAVRETYAGDALANYQMAGYFSELGLYRSSIIAAAAMLRQVGATVFDAPLYLGRLSFPVYYADLIMPLAERYDFDPRLQFALVRQESLFESFARSGAAAQGLSQVIPDTGAWIAQRLAWPDFENEDLYKPYVGLNFGAYYLSQQLESFDGNVHAALAAYNAGPGNAARWFDSAGADHDRFVDTVNFGETRLYIERIYEGFNAYRHLYNRP